MDKSASPFVSAKWLSENLGDKNIKILDGTYFLPVMKRDASAEYLDSHVPGAIFCDIEAISDPDKSRPHMLAGDGLFGQVVGEMGISNQDQVIVYDQTGLFSAPRLWWTFRVYGHKNVKILEGCLKTWKRNGYPVETGASRQLPKAAFIAKLDSTQVRNADDMLTVIKEGSSQIVDARSRGRFAGSEPEPWSGRVPGHMSGAFNLPHVDLIDGETQQLKPAGTMKALFEAEGLDLSRPIITSCGSGITASTLALALHVIGAEEVALYDASWSEWGLPENNLPIVTD
jgi:thiosulfate/3-mercaptopyruvate sulfurtransferase